MPTRKDQHISLNRVHTAQYLVGPRGDLVWRLSPWTAVAKQLPVRPLLADFATPATLILAVVPFDQLAIDFGHSSEAGQFAGPGRAPQRAGKHLSAGQPIT